MNNDGIEGFVFGIIFGGFIFFPIGVSVGSPDEVDTREYAELQAVKAGVAEYYIDANNEKAFRWKARAEK